MEVMHGTFLLLVLKAVSGQLITNETLAAEWLEQYNSMAEDIYYMSVTASWSYSTNITDYNLAQSVSCIPYDIF